MIEREPTIDELKAALEQAKGVICPYCAAGDPISLDTDGMDREGKYHAFLGGNKKCKASFIQDLLPSPEGQPVRSLYFMRRVA